MVLIVSPELSAVPAGQETGANSIPVVVANDQTLPVSSTTLATATAQATGNATLEAIDTKLGATLTVDTGLSGLAMQTTLSAVDTKAADRNTTLTNILNKIIAAPATSALQTTIDNTLTALSAKFGSLGQQTIANSVSIVPATGATVPVSSTTLATAANQLSGTAFLRNLNAVLAAGLWAGGTADNAAVTGTISAPGAGKAILLKNLTFSYGAAPTAARVLTVSEGASDIVNFAITAAGAGFVPIGEMVAVNTAATFSLPASGTAGAIGRLRIYYSIVDVIA